MTDKKVTDNRTEDNPRVPGYVRDIARTATQAPRTPGYLRDAYSRLKPKRTTTRRSSSRSR
jgi:hypothetical protein